MGGILKVKGNINFIKGRMVRVRIRISASRCTPFLFLTKEIKESSAMYYGSGTNHALKFLP